MKTLLLAALFFLHACSGADQEDAVKTRLPVPANEGSEEDRLLISTTLDKIEKYCQDLGQPHSFRGIPVVLSNSRQYSEHPAACISAGGEAQFILLKSSVLEKERELLEEGLESSLFRVLLHEIGHCYFGRKHEDARIEELGQWIEISHAHRGEEVKSHYPMIDSTVMVPEELLLPVALERYYVAEILNLARASRLEDLKPFAKVRYVREAPVGTGFSRASEAASLQEAL